MGEEDMLCMRIYTPCLLKNYEAINLCDKAVCMGQTAKLSLLRQIGGSLQSFRKSRGARGVHNQ